MFITFMFGRPKDVTSSDAASLVFLRTFSPRFSLVVVVVAVGAVPDSYQKNVAAGTASPTVVKKDSRRAVHTSEQLRTQI